MSSPVIDWTEEEVADWLRLQRHEKYVHLLCNVHCIDGRALLLLTESDLKNPPINIQVLGDVKRLTSSIRKLQLENQPALLHLGYDAASLLQVSGASHLTTAPLLTHHYYSTRTDHSADSMVFNDLDPPSHSHYTPPLSEDGRASRLRPEIWKTMISLGYLFVVTWITAFVMVIVHDRVPDMKKYPPLPDIFLDNVPHIPWAFNMCEWTGTLLLVIWLAVLLFHKHRLVDSWMTRQDMTRTFQLVFKFYKRSGKGRRGGKTGDRFILLRRFFALSGTVFLLRCVTMLITSLSVPGTHLECQPRGGDNMTQLLDDEWMKAGGFDYFSGELWRKMVRAYIIWSGAGMSIQGVRTCGDYMFSGHTVALTMLNFFITEYTPHDLYPLHTFTWLLNMFGVFFILSGHEHYSIDVFVAFYITSRLFLYYHTLANNQALMQRDSTRTRIWFPLFSFFESSIDGIVPNEYESPLVPLGRVFMFFKNHVSTLVVLAMAETNPRSVDKVAPTASAKSKTDVKADS